jgi:hypothetical protein
MRTRSVSPSLGEQAMKLGVGCQVSGIGNSRGLVGEWK